MAIEKQKKSWIQTVLILVGIIGLIVAITLFVKYKVAEAEKKVYVNDSYGDETMNYYGLNEPIELRHFSDGELRAIVAVKSVEAVMAEKPLIGVSYEITKKSKYFHEEAALLTFKGDANLDSFGLSDLTDSTKKGNKSLLQEYTLNEEAQYRLGVKQEPIDWYQIPIDTTVTFTKYYSYQTLQTHFGIYFPDAVEGEDVVSCVDLTPLVEDKTIDLSLFKKVPLDKQPEEFIKPGQVKETEFLDIKVDRVQVGTGESLGAGFEAASWEKDVCFAAVHVNVTNKSDEVIESIDIYSKFDLHLNEKTWFFKIGTEYKWEETFQKYNSIESIEPGESASFTLIYDLNKKEIPTSWETLYLIYNPNYGKDIYSGKPLSYKRLTKFEIPIQNGYAE